MKTEDNEEVKQFKTDLAKFSGHYKEFCVIVTAASGNLFWKSTNKTWAIGACHRYLACADEVDRHDERLQIAEDENET